MYVYHGIPHGDDVMLNYQTTGFHETATIRETLGLRPIKEFEEWMEKMGLMENGKLTSRAAMHLYLLNKRGENTNERKIKRNDCRNFNRNGR